MNIWILNHHALTPEMSGGTRHYDFAKELISRGHSVVIISSSFHYSKYSEMKEYGDKEYLQENIEGIEWVWLKTPPYRGNGVARVKNMLSYTHKAILILPTLNLPNPDIVMGSSVHLFAVYAAYRLSNRYKTPFAMEVRDLWPQTLIDMGISKWHPFIILLGWLEKFLYKKADKIITNLPYAVNYISKFTSKNKVEWISNGVDISQIPYTIPDNNTKLKITYTGALGVANNLSLLIQLAKQKPKDIEFLIVGDGAERAKLVELSRGLDNIIIQDPVAKNEVADILSNSDILYFNLKDSPVFKYGISSNKLFDYMASGRIVIFSSNAKNNPIKECNGGLTIEPDNIKALQNAIKQIRNMSYEQRVQIGKNSRKYCEQNYDIKVLVDKLERVLNKVKNG
jgi:glycosyltransferase involved in cell wall biosynthesis